MTSPYRTNAADTIAHLRELLSKATPGEWEVDQWPRDDDESEDTHFIRGVDQQNDRWIASCPHADGGVQLLINMDNTALIVAAVNAMPGLLDRLAKLERAFALARIMNAADISHGHARDCPYDDPRGLCDCEWTEYIRAQHDFAALANGEEP